MVTRDRESKKYEKALLKAVRKSFSSMSADVKRFIRAGLGDAVGKGATWSLSKETYVHAMFERGKFRLRVVIGDFMVAEVKRGARKPGIRGADEEALKHMVEFGPPIIVDKFVLSMKEVLGCGDPYEEVRKLLGSIIVLPWSRNGTRATRAE